MKNNLTPKEFAERMHLSLDTVYDRIKDNTYPFADHRGKNAKRPVWRIAKDVVEELEKNRLKEGA